MEKNMQRTIMGIYTNYIESNCSLLFMIGYSCSSSLYLNKEANPAVEKTKQCHKEWYFTYLSLKNSLLAIEYITIAVIPHEQNKKDKHLALKSLQTYEVTFVIPL